MKLNEILNPEFSTKAIVLFLAGSLIPFILAPYPAMQDTPDWALQASIFNKLIDGANAGQYSLRHYPVPNSIVTFGIALFNRLFSLAASAKLFCALVAIAFAASYVAFVRHWGDKRPLAEIIGAFFAVGHFFWMGYINFLAAAAILFFGLRFAMRKDGELTMGGLAALSAISLIAFFSHFLAWAALLACVAGLVFHFHRLRPAAWLKTGFAVSPSLAMLAWYAASRHGEFVAQYSYGGLLNWIWFKAAPFTPSTGFYPVTPEGIQWIVAILNIVFCAGFACLVGYAILQLVTKRNNPFLPAILILIGAGLFGPAQLYEVVRPFARWLFIGVLILIPFVKMRADFEMKLGRLAGAFLICVSVFNGVGAFHAGLVTQDYVRAMSAVSCGDGSVLAIADSHFGMRGAGALKEKMRDPFSYPNWVNPLRYAHQWHNAKIPQPRVDIFPSGMIRQNARLLAVNSMEQLRDARRIADYEILALSGIPKNLATLKQNAAGAFGGPVVNSDCFSVMAHQRLGR